MGIESSVHHPSLEEASHNIRGAENQNFLRYSHFPIVSQKSQENDWKHIKFMQSPASPSVAFSTSLLLLKGSESLQQQSDTRWASAAGHMCWFRRHYVFIFRFAGKQSGVISEERSGSPGIEGLNQTLVTAARRLTTIQQDSILGGPPVPSAKPALQAKKQREPLGSNIHLVTALILPAPSRATVSKAFPEALVPSRDCGEAFTAIQNVPCSSELHCFSPKQALVPLCASWRSR